jgi:hypothetical protein
MTMTAERYVDLFALVCDVVERNWHNRDGSTLDPDDGFRHTSREARAAASIIFEILDVPKPELPTGAVPPPPGVVEAGLEEMWVAGYGQHQGDEGRFADLLSGLIHYMRYGASLHDHDLNEAVVVLASESAEPEHVCCGHGAHVLEGGSGCCSPGHSAYLLATGQRGSYAYDPDD